MRDDNESQCSYNMLCMSEQSKEKHAITKDCVGCPENNYCLLHRYHER